MRPLEFADEAVKARQRLEKAERWRNLAGAATVAAGVAAGAWAYWSGAATVFVMQIGVITLVASGVLFARRGGGRLKQFDLALRTADPSSSLPGADGAWTFASQDGLYLGSLNEWVPFDGRRFRLESVAYGEDEHALIVQVWTLSRDRNGQEHERIDRRLLPLSKAVDPERALKQAVAWSKQAWNVRHRGGPAPEAG